MLYEKTKTFPSKMELSEVLLVHMMVKGTTSSFVSHVTPNSSQALNIATPSPQLFTMCVSTKTLRNCNRNSLIMPQAFGGKMKIKNTTSGHIGQL